MALNDIHPNEMQHITEMLIAEDGLRNLISATPMLSIFLVEFEAVARELKDARNLVENRDTITRNQLKEKRAAAEAQHDRTIRQSFFLLLSHQNAEDPELVQLATELRATLLPDGRSINNTAVSRKIGDASVIDGQLDDRMRTAMARITSAGGSVLDLHEARMRATQELRSITAQLLTMGEAEEQTEVTLTDAKRNFVRASKAFLSMVEFSELEPDVYFALTTPFERPQERADRKRRANDPGGETADIQDDPASLESGADTLDTGEVVGVVEEPLRLGD